MATEQEILEDTLLDEQIEQIADEIEAELVAEAQDESPSKPGAGGTGDAPESCLLYTSPSPRDE